MALSLRQKILLTTVFPIALIFCLLSAASLFLLTKLSIEYVRRSMFHLASYPVQRLNSMTSESEYVADVLLKYMVWRQKMPPSQQISAYFAFLVERNPSFAGLSIVERGGDHKVRVRVMVERSVTGVQNNSYTRAIRKAVLRVRVQEFQDLVRAGKHWSLYTNPLGKRVLSYASPLWHKGAMVGMLCVDLVVDGLLGNLKKIQKGYHFALLREDGVFLDSTNFAGLKSDLFLSKNAKILASSLRKNSGKLIKYSHRRQDYWFLAYPVQNLHWHFVVYASTAQTLTHVWQYSFVVLVLIVLAFSVIGFAFWCISRWLTKPISKLNVAVAHWTEGDLKGGRYFFHNDEIGALAKNFFKMAKQLKLRYEALRREQHANFSKIAQGLRGRYYYFTHDKNGKLTYISPSIKEIVGYSAAECLTHFSHYFTTHPTNNTAITNTQKILRGEPLTDTYSIEVRHKDGGIRYIELFKIPLRDSSERVIGSEGMGRDITDTICDNSELNSLLALMPDAMLILNLEGKIVLANARAEELFSCSDKQLAGQKLLKNIALEHRHSYMARLKQMQRSHNYQHTRTLESEIVSGYEQQVPVEITFSLFHTKTDTFIALALRSVVARKEAEVALRESEERYRRLVEGLQREYFFYSHTIHGEYTYVSPSVSNILGYSVEEFKKYNQLYLNENPLNQMVQENIAAVARGEWRPSYVCEFRHADGSRRFLEVLEVASFDSKGKVTAIEGIARDITRNKLAEEQLREARDAAQEANVAKSQFLSNMSHELRTPLNGVLGYTQVMLRDIGLSQEQKRNLMAIESCGQHLLTLINDILDLSKIENNKMEVSKSKTHLQTLLNSIRDMLWERANRKKLAFHMEIDPAVPATILTDATKLSQILVNLLGNAVKFTEQGFVQLSVTKQKDKLLFKVKDSGLGIDNAALVTIFEPFKQTEGGMVLGGTGLGLTISRHLVHLLGGQLMVTSTLAQGSVFTFTLPLSEPRRDEMQGYLELEDPTREGGQSWHLKSAYYLPLLIVEPESMSRDILRQLLAEVGFTVLACASFSEASVLVKQKTPAAVLLNLDSCDDEALQFIEHIRQNHQLSACKILGIYSRQKPLSSTYTKILHYIDDSISKPYRALDVYRCISSSLGIELACEDLDPIDKELKYFIDHLSLNSARSILQQLRAAFDSGDIRNVHLLARQIRVRHGESTLTRFLENCWQNFEIEKLENLQILIEKSIKHRKALC